MNDILLRSECVRQASQNLGLRASDTDLVIEEAGKLYDFIVGRVTLPPVKQAA